MAVLLPAFVTANLRAAVLRVRIQRYVNILLTSNPAAYLHPQYKGQIDLRRLTRVYQWIDPTLDENAVFDLQRENLVKLVQDPNKWVDSLPSAILDRVEVAWGWFGPKISNTNHPQFLENGCLFLPVAMLSRLSAPL